MPLVSLMQFSDLHRSLLVYDSNKALVSSLLSDIARYSTETVPVSKPDLLIVCGDIVQGSESSVDKIERQYAEVNDFLNRLCDAVFNGDKKRVIIVPGNHDVSWPHSRNSMEKLEDYNSNYAELLKEPRSDFRWNFKDGSCHRISDYDLYSQRFVPFSKFYSGFYDNQRNYSLKPEEQYDMFEFPEKNLLFVGFNSCFRNDHLNHIGMINPECIANCHSFVIQEKYKHWIKIAVWHHGIHGIPTKNDFMDERIVQFLIDKGFRIGLHGHQHKSDFFKIRFSADYSQKMLIFGCGTLCAPKEKLPLGETRQYSIIESGKSYSRLRFHIRKGIDQPPGCPIWMPGNIKQNYEKSYMDVPLETTISFGIDEEIRKETAGEESRLQRNLAIAEDLVARKDYKKALKKLEPLPQENPFVRRLTIECFFQLEMDEKIIQYIKTPITVTEFTYLSEALWRKKEFLALRQLVDDQRQSPEISGSEQFKRIDARLKDRGY